MERIRNKIVLLMVAAFAVVFIALIAGAATASHGKHHPCEHGRHRHNKHCVVSATSSSSTSTSTSPSTVISLSASATP